MKNIIENYVSKLTVGDIYDFIKDKELEVDIKDIETVYRYIKKYWKDILDGDNSSLDLIKKEVSSSTYQEIMKLYNKYKKWI